jgi:predicted small secreted protein
MFKRILALPLMLLAAAPVLSGCSTDSLTAQGIAQAAETTSAKGGAKVSMRTTTSIPGGGALQMTGDGVIDSKRRAGHMTMRFGGLVPGGEAMTQEMIFDRFTIYMRSELFGAGLQSGKKWLKFDLAKVSKGLGIDLSQLAQVGQDPSQSMQMLKAVGGEVKKVGEDEVRGVDTTHYSATVDFDKYPAAVPASDRAAVKKSIERLVKLSGQRTIPVDVWVDDDEVVRRVAQTIKTKVPGAGSMQMKMTMDFYDFGTKVDVEKPPADQVQDISDLAAGLRTP